MEEDDIFESEELYMDEEESSYVEDKEDADDRTDSKVGTVSGFVKNKFSKAEKLDTLTNNVGSKHIRTIVVCTDLMFSLHLQKSLECLLKLLRPRFLQLMVKL